WAGGEHAEVSGWAAAAWGESRPEALGWPVAAVPGERFGEGDSGTFQGQTSEEIGDDGEGEFEQRAGALCGERPICGPEISDFGAVSIAIGRKGRGATFERRDHLDWAGFDRLVQEPANGRGKSDERCRRSFWRASPALEAAGWSDNLSRASAMGHRTTLFYGARTIPEQDNIDGDCFWDDHGR